MTEQKKYHKVFVGRYHRDNKAPSFLKCSTQNTCFQISAFEFQLKQLVDII